MSVEIIFSITSKVWFSLKMSKVSRLIHYDTFQFDITMFSISLLSYLTVLFSCIGYMSNGD